MPIYKTLIKKGEYRGYIHVFAESTEDLHAHLEPHDIRIYTTEVVNFDEQHGDTAERSGGN